MRKALATGASLKSNSRSLLPVGAPSTLSHRSQARRLQQHSLRGLGCPRGHPSPGCDGRSGETTGLAGRGCQGAHLGGTAAKPPVRAPQKRGRILLQGRPPVARP